MSETTGSGSIEQPFMIKVDPSAEDVPSAMIGAYADMNRRIAQERAQYGAILHYDHIINSRRDIAETAQEALHRTPQGADCTAIILGAGGCIDIPLEQVVTDFDKTTVVDIDTEQTEQALSKLPPKLLGKVALVRAELSGIARGLNDTFEQASPENDYTRFLCVAAAMVGKLDIAGSQVEFGTDYTFVCSQLLMTQLSAIPVLHFNQMIKERYGKSLTMEPGHQDESLLSGINEQNAKLQMAHIAQLGRLVSSNGTVHFADTLAKVTANRTLPMVLYDAIVSVSTRFSELREANVWEYTSSMNKAFIVASYSLAPKPIA